MASTFRLGLSYMLTGNSLIYGLKNFLPKVKAKIFDGTADSVFTDTSVKWLVSSFLFPFYLTLYKKDVSQTDI